MSCRCRRWRLAVIASVKRFADTDLITPGARSKRTGKTAPISGWSKSWPRLLKIAEEHGLKRRPALHDLRKTFRSHLARLGVADRVAERMLNHTPTDRLIGIYDRHDYLAEKSRSGGEMGRRRVCRADRTAGDARQRGHPATGGEGPPPTGACRERRYDRRTR